MNLKAAFIKFSLFPAILVTTLSMSISVTYAADPYDYYTDPNGYTKCVSDSNRPNIYSVTNYACKKAIAKAQNACASWIGPAGDSASNVIDATGASGDIPIKIWGMCTYYDNPSSMMQIMNHSDGDSIVCADGDCNFNRTGNWGAASIGSKDATLNIAKFIDHAPTVVIGGETYYYRVVILKRQHGGNTSQDLDFSYIYLKVGGITPPPPVLDTCSSAGWPNPASYTNSDENEGTTSVDIKIRNTADRFIGRSEGNWGDTTLFAKPTDVIAWHTCYYPGVQTTADTEVSKVVGGWQGYEEPLSTTSCESDKHVEFKPLKNVATPWENKLIGEGINNVTQDFSPPENHTDVKERDDSYTTTVDDVGGTFTETSKTGSPRHAKITETATPTADYKDDYCGTCYGSKNEDEDDCDCTDGLDGYTGCDADGNNCHCACYGLCCTNKYDADKFATATVDFTPAEDSLSVKVPYNYQKRTGVNIYDDIVYAGETIRIQNVWTMIIPRWNEKTFDAYATKTSGNTEIKLYAYVTPNQDGDKNSFEVADSDGCSVIRTTNKQCTDLDTESAALNSSGNLLGSDDQFFDGNYYNVFDASAGDYFCLVSSVSKEEPRDDEDMDDTGNGKWAYSEPTCAVIAKRPSFQVWGSDMYSNSEIDAIPGTKRNVYNGYHNTPGVSFIKTGGGSTIYGSWVEQGLMLGGTATTNNLASGATTGSNLDGTKAYAGANNGDFCENRSPLTISNYDGSDCHVGSSGIVLNPDNNDRRKLISYWVESPGGSSPTSASGATINYTSYSTDTTISSMTIPKSTTEIIEVDGTLTISGNITYFGHYADNFTASDTLREIPKMIIYADNVDIECGVEKLDAIIITKVNGTVNTCSNAGGIDDANRSHQLKIFGLVMTDNIELGRTYGQAAWGGTPTPNGQKEAAEIFDFDSSILLWSEFMASSAETDTLQTVYQIEIAPRY